MIRFSEARPRKGFTLTEVLMAMFVMAIGMISLLALFPAAFQQAKWALDNEQVARAAANAQASTEMPHMQVATLGGMPVVSGTAQSVRNDDNYRPAFGNNNSSMPWKQLAYNAVASPAIATELNNRLGRGQFLVNYDILTDPTNLPATAAYRWTFDTNVYAAGNVPNSLVKLPPVFVDPMVADTYIEAAFTNLPHHVGADLATNVPFRRGINSVTGTLRPLWSVGIPRFSLSRYRYDVDPTGIRKTIETSMGDEINFDTNGQPLLTAGQFARQQRFTWAYMCYWPNYDTPEICEVTAVMFNSRPQLNGLSATPPGEVTYTGTIALPIFTKGLTQATIILGATPQPINVKVNDWVLDSTFILPEYDPTPVQVATALVPGIPPPTAPFLDRISTIPYVIGGRSLLPGLVGGNFYKILDISSVQGTSPNFFQTITIDRPAKSDGLSATFMAGIADVITKSVGKMPQR